MCPLSKENIPSDISSFSLHIHMRLLFSLIFAVPFLKMQMFSMNTLTFAIDPNSWHLTWIRTQTLQACFYDEYGSTGFCKCLQLTTVAYRQTIGLRQQLRFKFKTQLPSTSFCVTRIFYLLLWIIISSRRMRQYLPKS